MRCGLVERWSDLVVAESALCTQLYAHIVRTSIWRDFWKGRDLPESHTTGISTYPHTWMLAATVFDRPSWRISEPVLTIFNGAQSWGDPVTRARVYFRGLPELIRLFEEQGLGEGQLEEARRFNAAQGAVVIRDYFASSRARPCRDLMRFSFSIAARDRHLLVPLWAAFLTSDCSAKAQALRRTFEVCRAVNVYLFYNCRPARWWWSKVSRFQ